MFNLKSASQHAVDEFFRALSERDLSIASAVFTNETMEIIPLAMDGEADPERVFEGKDAVLGYLQLILDNFKQVVLWIGTRLLPTMAPPSLWRDGAI